MTKTREELLALKELTLARHGPPRRLPGLGLGQAVYSLGAVVAILVRFSELGFSGFWLCVGGDRFRGDPGGAFEARRRAGNRTEADPS